VHHDDDVGSAGQRLSIAGLLVPPVAVVSIMNVDVQAQFVCPSYRLIRATIVNKNSKVNALGQFSHRRLERPFCIVGR